MKSLLCSILHIFVTKKQLFFLFFHLSGDSFLCCCLKQKIVFIWFEKSRCVECLIMLAGASLQVLLISHFFFAISFLSSLSFKVLNWSKLSSDTSRLDPISIRSRPNPNPIPTRDFLSIETRLGVKEEGDEADVLADRLELLLQTTPERKNTKNSEKLWK